MNIAQKQQLNAERKVVPSKLYHRFQELMPMVCVDVAVYVPGKGLFLGKRSMPPVKDLYWLPGGRLIYGEKPEDCAARKVKEETGMDIKVLGLLGIGDTVFEAGEKRHTVNLTYLAFATGNEVKLSADFTSYKFVDTVSEDMHPYLRKMLSDSGIMDVNGAVSIKKLMRTVRLDERTGELSALKRDL